MPSVPTLRTILLIAISLAGCATKEPAPAPASRSQQVIGAPDLSREFDVSQASAFGRSNTSFATKAARSEGFYFQQKFQPKNYEARPYEAKDWENPDAQFATRDAAAKGKYETPNVTKVVEAKTAPSRDARESGKLLATRDVPDGGRPYLGQEATKMKKPLDPNNLPKITNEMHELKTVEDVKTLLNKNR